MAKREVSGAVKVCGAPIGARFAGDAAGELGGATCRVRDEGGAEEAAGATEGTVGAATARAADTVGAADRLEISLGRQVTRCVGQWLDWQSRPQYQLVQHMEQMNVAGLPHACSEQSQATGTKHE